MYPYSAAETDAFLSVPAFRKNRLLWPLCALLLSAFVLLAMPGARIQLGASQLKGLVGSYTGHGNWHIITYYQGTVSVNNPAPPETVAVFVNGTQVPITGNIAILSTAGSISTETGGISTSLNVVTAIDGDANATIEAHTSGVQISATLVWLPENNDSNFDPPPHSVTIFHRGSVKGSTSAIAYGQGQTMQTQTTSNLDKATTLASSTSTGPAS